MRAGSQARAATRLALSSRRSSARRSLSPNSSQKRSQWPLDVMPMKTCSPSAAVKSWYTPQPMRVPWRISGIGTDGWPVAACWASHWPTQKTTVSKRPEVIFCPRPVCAR